MDFKDTVSERLQRKFSGPLDGHGRVNRRCNFADRKVVNSNVLKTLVLASYPDKSMVICQK